MDLSRILMLRLQGAPIDAPIANGKDAPQPPPPPNPQEQIVAEAKARPNVYAPSGSVVYSGDPTSGNYRQDVTLAPGEQAVYEGRNRVAQALLGRAERQIPGVPDQPIQFDEMNPNARAAADRLATPAPSARSEFGDFAPAGDPRSEMLAGRQAAMTDTPFMANVSGDAVRDAVFAKQKALLDPHFDREEERLQQKLANQGLPMGSEAFKTDFGDFAKARDQSYERAALDSVTAGADEEQRQFGRQLSTREQQMADIAAALSGSRGAAGDEFGRALGTRQQKVGELADDFSRGTGAASTSLSAETSLDETERARRLQERQQNYNELAALLGGSQLQPIGGAGGSLDTAGAYANQQAGLNRQFQGQVAGYQGDVGMTNAAVGSSALIAAAFI